MSQHLDTWIGNRLITIDLDRVWVETFARWDALVDTDTAAEIATATEHILRQSYEHSLETYYPGVRS